MEIYASIDPQGIVRKKFQINFPEEKSMINEMVYPPAENERMSPEKQPFQKENSLPTIILKGACLVFGGCKFCQTTCIHHRKRKTHWTWEPHEMKNSDLGNFFVVENFPKNIAKKMSRGQMNSLNLWCFLLKMKPLSNLRCFTILTSLSLVFILLFIPFWVSPNHRTVCLCFFRTKFIRKLVPIGP